VKRRNRAEGDKVVHAPIVVILGGQEYKINILVIKDSRPWRAKVVKALSKLPEYTKVTTDDSELFGKAIDAMLVGMPDTVLDLFFEYAKSLDREEIEDVASDAEVAKAFEQVVEVAFPLANSLVGTMTSFSQ